MQHLHKFTSPVNGEWRTELEMDLKPEPELETYLKPETWLGAVSPECLFELEMMLGY